jgi:hypothetical protein
MGSALGRESREPLTKPTSVDFEVSEGEKDFLGCFTCKDSMREAFVRRYCPTPVSPIGDGAVGNLCCGNALIGGRKPYLNSY